MNEFYKIASPTTLASLIADINAGDLSGDGLTLAQRQLLFLLRAKSAYDIRHRQAQWRILDECRRRLIANVGEVEAEQLIAGMTEGADLAYGRQK